MDYLTELFKENKGKRSTRLIIDDQMPYIDHSIISIFTV